MWWNLVSILLLVLLAACVKLLICFHLHSVEPGEYTELKLMLEAKEDAPELEMLLKSLLWLRSNHILRAEISVCDQGLTEEAIVLARKLCRRESIPFIERE